jgi:acyl-CoA hydrolase
MSREHEYGKKLQTADQALLSPDAGVVPSRGLVRYVVTELGMAYLHDKSIRERAQALIRNCA